MGVRSSKLSSEQINEIQPSTKFTVEELTDWHRSFLNDHPSGFLKESHFIVMYSQFFSPAGSSGATNPGTGSTSRRSRLQAAAQGRTNPGVRLFAARVFASFDREGRGIVTFKDLIHGFSIATRGTIEEKLEWAFRIYDVDRDQMIGREEMLQVVTAIYQMAGYSPGYSSAGPSVGSFGSSGGGAETDELSFDEDTTSFGGAVGPGGGPATGAGSGMTGEGSLGEPSTYTRPISIMDQLAFHENTPDKRVDQIFERFDLVRYLIPAWPGGLRP
ncbi:hypothetical protein H696_01248 [Fonticula alba]|uniref:EF-hand domain-containing protein n=1 Tax=Fonticula alba TaxID=691883 RepID=A0A058ZBQ6_FONAL|nr:hypothetical protein H696_01248 [Fonticula alba]KCV71829.1 hypothetical protein H696_01248 [Fonticula alba]|eukprot:XP_009493407.1 hypothetical protein H696_01248 [Fonticula alba]